MSGRPVILDWRGPAVRGLSSLWERWEVEEPEWIRGAARLTDPVLDALLARRLRSRGRPPARPFLISVGNLAAGGTGKTPVVIDLGETLSRRGITGAVVTRGYGARRPSTRVVAAGDGDAGDEARLMASRLPAWTVVQAPRREHGVVAALRAAPDAAVIVLEDAHQTAAVARHLDVLILDRWRLADGRVVPETGHRLPWGPYREGPAGAERAACWLLSLAQDDGDVALPPPGAGREILAYRRGAVCPDLDPPPAGKAFAVVSGIARPERFEAECARLAGAAPRLCVRCADHARYDAATVRALLSAGEAHGAAAWFVTEKDWIKLRDWWPPAVPVAVPSLILDWTGGRSLADLVEARLRGDPGARLRLP